MGSQKWCGLAAVVVLLAAAGALAQSTPNAKWTFMVYLDADNNLEEVGIDDFLEMAEVGSTDNVQIVVQFDRVAGYSSEYGDWTGTKRFRVTAGMEPTTASAEEDLGEVNMGDSNSLVDFIDWAKDEYPADNYVLVLWNHGSGWHSPGPEAEPPAKAAESPVTAPTRESPFTAVCEDVTDADTLYNKEVRQALESAGADIRILAFDACLMGMLEVAYEMRDVADILVGSELTEPGPGWAYDTLLQDLVDDPEMTGNELAAAMVDHYMESYDNSSVNLSAIDLSKVAALAEATFDLGDSLVANWAHDDHTEMEQAATLVLNRLDEAVIANGFDPATTPNANGLAVYFPLQDVWFDDDYSPVNILFASGSWDEFVQQYYIAMESSWVRNIRLVVQSFDDGYGSNIDLGHFAELVVDPPVTIDYYTQEITSETSFEEVGTPRGWHADDTHWGYDLPFPFTYFGQSYSRICISSNGYILFQSSCASFSDYTNSEAEFIAQPMVAAMWDNIVTDETNQVGEDIYIEESAERVVIRWVGELYSSRHPVNLEMVLQSNGIIEFRYGSGNINLSPTIGISAGDGANYYLAPYNNVSNLGMAQTVRYVPVGLIDPPTSVSAAPGDGCGNVVLNWTASEGATGYKVFYREDQAGPPWAPLNDGDPASGESVGNVTSVAISGLAAGQTYHFAVTAFDADFESTYSESDSTLTGTTCAFRITSQVDEGAGELTCDPPGPTYTYGQIVNLTFKPTTCYRLRGWVGTDDDSSTSLNNTIRMTDDRAVGVDTVISTHVVKTKILGGHGRICCEPQQYSYQCGENIALTVQPEWGYRVRAWHGTDNDASTDTTNSFVVDDDKEIIVELEPVAYNLNINVPTGHGKVLTQPEGSNFGPGQTVLLMAVPDWDYRVKSWSGARYDNTTGYLNVVPMDGHKTVTVEFMKIPEFKPPDIVTYTLQANVADGEGRVEPDLKVCAPGETVTLLATPASGWRVKSWTGTDDDASTENFNVVTVDADTVVSVEFMPAPTPEGDPNDPNSGGSGGNQDPISAACAMLATVLLGAVLLGFLAIAAPGLRAKED